MTDVKVYGTNDDGEVNITAAGVELSSGIDTAVYISLFGGNAQDSGNEGDDKEWWGNVDEDSGYRIRSRFQHLFDKNAPVPSSLGKLEDAATADLKWLTDDGLAESVSVSASLSAPKKILLTVTIKIDGESHQFSYPLNWTEASS